MNILKNYFEMKKKRKKKRALHDILCISWGFVFLYRSIIITYPSYCCNFSEKFDTKKKLGKLPQLPNRINITYRMYVRFYVFKQNKFNTKIIYWLSMSKSFPVPRVYPFRKGFLFACRTYIYICDGIM